MSLHTRLFVGNLPENINQNDLHEAFSAYGQIINVDLKNKSNVESDQKKFAFITFSASNYEVESCIKHFSNGDFRGRRLYVTRARESFLERLQRERSEAQRKEAEKNDQTEGKKVVLKLGDKLNPRKRKLEHTLNDNNKTLKVIKPFEKRNQIQIDLQHGDRIEKGNSIEEKDKKKIESDKKRIASLKKKRQEFKEKQMIIKTGLIRVDKVPNKKVIFSDNEEETESKVVNGKENMKSKSSNQKNSLFDEDDSDDNVNFVIKKQFEGKKGQKVLDLQSRYISDKRFILDERFIEDDQPEEEAEDREEKPDDDERIDLEAGDEKSKQLNILQDVLGVSIKARHDENDSRKTKTKLGMLRFDPTQPEHAKFLVPVEYTKDEPTKKSKKKKLKEKHDKEKADNVETEDVDKVEVSKEQFYKVSKTLKESLVQPNSFSLRSLFGHNEETEKEVADQNTNYIPLETSKEPKVRNPLDPSGKKNPFVYDSSESEDEEVEKESKQNILPEAKTETIAVWRENLFFSKIDSRLHDGLAFFNKADDNEAHKERRELKSVMKKRIYNKERKNQMFQKKIGGRKKSLKKSYRIK